MKKYAVAVIIVSLIALLGFVFISTYFQPIASAGAAGKGAAPVPRRQGPQALSGHRRPSRPDSGGGCCHRRPAHSGG